MYALMYYTGILYMHRCRGDDNDTEINSLCDIILVR